MTARRYTLFCLFMILAVPLFITACGGGNGGGGTSTATPTITSVTVGCSPASISTNQTSACTPTVNGTGSFSSSVTWSVSPTSMGTVSSAGVFTPTGAGTATVTATSTQDSTKSGNSTVTVTVAVAIASVSVSCSPTSIQTNQTSACTATVNGTGSFSSAVTWSLSPSSIGSVSSTGVFTPTTTGTATITATSTQDATKSGSTGVSVTSTQSPGSGAWTWMSGSDTASTPTNAQPGIYGTKGVAAASNVPGARVSAVSWIDNSGNLWLFGGDVYDWLGELGILNDLWEFNPTSKEWTWVSGANQVATKNGGSSGLYGVYGTQGVVASTNIPGARSGAVSWTDSSGNLWLFGGQGYDSSGENGFLNDLWEFSSTSKEWTWVSGSSTVGSPNGGQPGIYGTRGSGSATSAPGGRFGASGGIDGSGNLWLFGGLGFAATGPYGALNDLWRFNPTAKTWTWVSGSDTLGSYGGQFGVYGTLGASAGTNVPGGRVSAVSWIDGNGDLWLFGGGGYGSNGRNGYLDDLWEFTPANAEWTWVSGSSSANSTGVFGTLGSSSTATVPVGLQGAIGWIDGSGNLWLFGGIGPNGNLNDLWEFSATNNEWTWVSGDSASGTVGTGIDPGTYGTIGVPSATNIPMGRNGAVSWIDSSGNLWLFGGTSAYAYAGGELNDLWRYQP